MDQTALTEICKKGTRWQDLATYFQGIQVSDLHHFEEDYFESLAAPNHKPLMHLFLKTAVPSVPRPPAAATAAAAEEPDSEKHDSIRIHIFQSQTGDNFLVVNCAQRVCSALFVPEDARVISVDNCSPYIIAQLKKHSAFRGRLVINLSCNELQDADLVFVEDIINDALSACPHANLLVNLSRNFFQYPDKLIKALLKRDRIVFVSLVWTPFSRLDRRTFFQTLDESERRATAAEKLVFIPVPWLEVPPDKFAKLIPPELNFERCVATQLVYNDLCKLWLGTAAS